jgi:hypothetical protein
MADYYAAPSEEDFDRLNRQVVRTLDYPFSLTSLANVTGI